MTEYQAILDNLRAYTSDYVPASIVSHVGWVSAGTLVLGLLLSAFGARLARFAISGAFVLAGGALGTVFAGAAGLHPAPCVAVAAAIVGAIGFMTYRLWAGVATALVFSAIVLGVFGYQRVTPHLTGFSPDVQLVSAAEPHDALLAAPGGDLPAPSDVAQQWFTQLRGYLNEKDARLEQNGKAIALGTGLIALFIGVVAVRYALIACTSIVGTVLVGGALLGMCQRVAPDFYGSAVGRPGILGIAAGAFLVTSLILQFILTRPARAAEAKPAARAAA